MFSVRRRRICSHKWTPWARIGQRVAYARECLKCGTVYVDSGPVAVLAHTFAESVARELP